MVTQPDEDHIDALRQKDIDVIADFLMLYCGDISSKKSVKGQIVTDLRREAGWIKTAVRELMKESQAKQIDAGKGEEHGT